MALPPDPRQPRTWKAWVPSLLLLLLLLPAVLCVEVYLHRRLGGSGSVLELTRPPGHLDSVQIRFLDSASRQDIAALALQLTDPRNPLGLPDAERVEAREHLARMAQLADRHLWEMERFVGLLDGITLQRHQELLKDQHGTMRMQWARPEVVASLVQQRYGGLDPDAAPTEEVPKGWAPDADPEAYGLFTATFTGENVDRVSDIFLITQVQNLTVLHMETPTTGEDPVRAARLVQSVARIQEIVPQLRQEWINLYHRFVMPYPDRAASVPIGPRRPDLSYVGLAAALRQAGSR